MTYKQLVAVSLISFQFSLTAVGATLQPETKTAWDTYLSSAQDGMQTRLRAGSHFLWIDDTPGMADFVRVRGPYVGPVSKQIPRKVPAGLIHDWIGVSFIPNAKVTDILEVLRDYDHYKDVYKPGVIASTLQSTGEKRDLFTLRMVNRSVVAKTALDADTEATYIRVDDHRWYAYSNTLHMREVEKFGTPEERLLPEDQGTGLIWRLSSFTRLEERDGGVYTELEAIALSRDVPGAVRVFVTPIVKRVSRDSMATSLRQTRIAVDSGLARKPITATAHTEVSASNPAGAP